MNEYLLSVLGIVLLCSLFTAISPEGKTSTVIKGIARLACVLTIIAPVLRFFKTGSIEEFFDEKADNFFSENVIDGDEAFIQYYSELRIRETEEALQSELAQNYVEGTEVAIDWSIVKTEDDYAIKTVRIDRICVALPEGTSEEVKEKVWLYLTKNYCSEVLLE